MDLRNILVPIDFHEGSAELLDRAVEIAAQLEASITLVHVWQVPVYGFPVGAALPAIDLGKAIEASAKRALDELIESHRDRGVEIRPMLRVGTPWEQILEAAKEVSADLVVMATHGRKGLPRALLGSVAEKVIRMSEIPVLTYRLEGT